MLKELTSTSGSEICTECTLHKQKGARTPTAPPPISCAAGQMKLLLDTGESFLDMHSYEWILVLVVVGFVLLLITSMHGSFELSSFTPETIRDN